MEPCKTCKGDIWQILLKYPLRIIKSIAGICELSICLDCMIEHCTAENCLGCKHGKYPDCQFFNMKKHYFKDQ